jgi:hypothetical protein
MERRMTGPSPSIRDIGVVLMIAVSGFLAQGCTGFTCEPRPFTPSGDLTTDLIGTWDWSHDGIRNDSDKWAYTFFEDGGVSVLHSYTAIDPAPVSSTEPYTIVDGGYLLPTRDPAIRFVEVQFRQNTLLARETSTSTFVAHPALTCRGAGFTH